MELRNFTRKTRRLYIHSEELTSVRVNREIDYKYSNGQHSTILLILLNLIDKINNSEFVFCGRCKHLAIGANKNPIVQLIVLVPQELKYGLI